VGRDPGPSRVAAHGPSFAPERWEEQSGYSPSTIAAEIAGLVAAAEIANHNHDDASASLWLGVADDYQRSIKDWTVTTNGPLGTGRYFIRLSKTGDPNAAITHNVGNGGPARLRAGRLNTDGRRPNWSCCQSGRSWIVPSRDVSVALGSRVRRARTVLAWRPRDFAFQRSRSL